MSQQLNSTCLPKDPDLAESFDVTMVNGYSLPSFAVRFLNQHGPSFETREDDIYVVSYPKTGTTWTQEIVYLLCSKLNFQCAASESLNDRFPYIEHAASDVNYIQKMPSPRLIKTHYPYSLLPDSIISKNCKIIYVTRNPKDVVVSYYHFACWLPETKYQGTFSQFYERFMKDRTTYSPFLLHNLEFWMHRNDDNILFLFYEDMQQDLSSNIKKIAEFLGKSLSAEELVKVEEHCSFKSMSAAHTSQDKAKKFFRKGVVGDWKNYFTEEENLRMDKWIEDALQGSGLQFIYE